MKRFVFAYWLPILLFLIAVVSAFLLLDLHNIPTLFPDSNSYIEVATQIKNWAFPSLNARTPVYPLYLALTTWNNNLSLAVYGQILLGGVSSIICYLITLKITKSKWISFITGLLVCLDFQLTSFRGAILSESLSSTILLLFIFIRIQMIGRPIKALDIVTLVVSDFFLVYTRPAFLAVPVAYYICVLIVYLVKKARLEVIKIISCAIVFALVLVGYCTINYFKTGIFEVSIISDINFLGKELQYGLVGGDSSNQTSVIQDISGYGVRGEKNPYTIINNVFPDYNYDFQQIRSANKYFLKGNKLVFLTDSIGLVPRIMSAPRQFYVAPNSTYAYAYSKYDIIYGVLNLINLYTVILATLLAIYLLIKRQANALPIIIILLSIFASVMTISGTAYSEYVRMKAPLQPLLQIMFVICVWGVFNLRKIRKI